MSKSNLITFVCAFIFTSINGYFNAKYLITIKIEPSLIQYLFGISLFIIGFIINYQSDSILINLRKNRKGNSYSIPKVCYTYIINI